MTEKAKQTLRELLNVEKCPHWTHMFLGYNLPGQSLSQTTPTRPQTQTTNTYNTNTNTWSGWSGMLGGAIGQGLGQQGAGSGYSYTLAPVYQTSLVPVQQSILPQQSPLMATIDQYADYTSIPEPYSDKTHIWKVKNENITKYIEWCDHHSPSVENHLYERTDLI